MKNEYDGVIDSFGDDIRTVSGVKIESMIKEQDWSSKLKAKDLAHRNEISAKSAIIATLEKELKKKEEEIHNFKSFHDTSELKIAKLVKENSELRQSGNILTSSLQRSDDEKRILQNNEMILKTEVQNNKSMLAKSIEEVERLRNVLNDTESVHASLVAPEVVMRHVDTIKSLRAELASKQNVHKHLIDRYSTLKASVENGFKYYEESSNGNVYYIILCYFLMKYYIIVIYVYTESQNPSSSPDKSVSQNPSILTSAAEPEITTSALHTAHTAWVDTKTIIESTIKFRDSAETIGDRKDINTEKNLSTTSIQKNGLQYVHILIIISIL